MIRRCVSLFILKTIQQNLFCTKIRLILILFVLYPLNVHCENFKAASDTWSPFFMISDNQFSGIGFEILKEIVRRTGDTVTFQHVPTKRALRMFDEKEIDIMIDSPLWADPEKAEAMIFSNEVMSVKEYIYFLKENYIEVKKSTNLRGKSVGIMRGYYYPVFEDAFKKGIVKKFEVDYESSLIKILIKKRATAIFMDSITFQYNISQLGYDKKIFKKGLQLSNAALGIKIRREKAHILSRFNRAIDAMKTEGTISRIIKKYTE
ncbi:MAG: amino acid ABC transporter substrate-binding protein [Desulfobacterales bacterium]|nr:amino acid ABC transporter substrate-binding protein [Desulfobacterales bacterium]